MTERKPSGKEVLPSSFFEMESLLRNVDPHNLVAPLREARSAISEVPVMASETVKELEPALRLQDQWQGWLFERESLRKDTERGRECLEQVRRELAALCAQLAQWPLFERSCGPNPLENLLQQIEAKERIEHFLA